LKKTNLHDLAAADAEPAVERVQPEIQGYLGSQPTTLQALRRFFMSIHEHVLMQPGIYQALQSK
jgi:hypothetical protein